jgi:hypothetical protein
MLRKAYEQGFGTEHVHKLTRRDTERHSLNLLQLKSSSSDWWFFRCRGRSLYKKQWTEEYATSSTSMD